jgi:hypothetical protein
MKASLDAELITDYSKSVYLKNIIYRSNILNQVYAAPNSHLSFVLHFFIFLISFSTQNAQAEPYTINWQNDPPYIPVTQRPGAGEGESTAAGMKLYGISSARSFNGTNDNSSFSFSNLTRSFTVSKNSAGLSDNFTLKLTGVPKAVYFLHPIGLFSSAQIDFKMDAEILGTNVNLEDIKMNKTVEVDDSKTYTNPVTDKGQATVGTLYKLQAYYFAYTVTSNNASSSFGYYGQSPNNIDGVGTFEVKVEALSN